MKKTISVLLAIFFVMSIAMIPVFAQDGGSATGDDYELIITPQGSTAAYEQINDNLAYAAADPCDPESGYEKVYEFDASRVKKNSQGADGDFNHGAFTFTVSINLDGKDWYVMHYEDNEVWKKVSGCSYSGGTLTIPGPSLSVFAVYAKASSTSGGGSPATGDNSAYFVLMAVVFSALAVVFVKKAVKNN